MRERTIPGAQSASCLVFKRPESAVPEGKDEDPLTQMLWLYQGEGVFLSWYPLSGSLAFSFQLLE